MERTTGDVIRILRKRKGISQEELGKVLGVKRGTIQKYENNSISLGIDTVRALCLYFHVMPWVFIFPQTAACKFFIEMKEAYEENLMAMNDIGRAKVLEYIADISMNETYRKKIDD